MPTVEIDGRSIEVEDGLTVIQAADRLGIEIPHYCWHPGLSIAGNCRMCLVEIEKMPKLQIACNTRVTDGMKVSTRSDKTQVAQKAVLEFLLVNHPIDCPVCDQAGECKLQEYYMDYDRQRSRVPLELKVKKRKAFPIGPLVILDQERCILCARCTRFLDEITKTSELGIYERGDHAEIDLAPGKVLDNKYSGNVVDICPVGALTSRDFRFRARVWYQERTPSICSGCANGCNIDVFHREQRIYRYQPRFNPEVNQYWMCDEGRLSYHGLQGEGRLLQHWLRGPDRFAGAPWTEAVARVADTLGAVAKQHEAGSVGIIVSAQAPNEEVALVRRLATALQARLVAVSWSPPDAYADDFLIKPDRNPNTQGLVLQGLEPNAGVAELIADAAAGKLAALVVVRTDLFRWAAHPQLEKALETVRYLVVVDTHQLQHAQYANAVLAVGTHAESDGSFTNHARRVQRFWQAFPPPGDAQPGWRALAELAGRVDGHPAPESASAVFAESATQGGPFGGLTYGALGPHGAPAAASS